MAYIIYQQGDLILEAEYDYKKKINKVFFKKIMFCNENNSLNIETEVKIMQYKTLHNRSPYFICIQLDITYISARTRQKKTKMHSHAFLDFRRHFS